MNDESIMEEYQYTPLTARTIRVLLLLPTAPDDDDDDAPLEGTLLEYQLTKPDDEDGEYPELDYECVSYVWGDEAKPFRLAIDGRPLPITASLDSLLRRLRRVIAPHAVRLWADAVCINQADPVEKAEQVALMRHIYSAAQRVIIDLGEESEDLDDAINMMHAWWRKNLWDGILIGNRVVGPEAAAMLMDVQLPSLPERCQLKETELPDHGDAVARFFDRPWFSRLWVIQEFVLARRVVFICGRREVPWRDVVGATLRTIADGTLAITSASALSVARMFSFGMIACRRQARLLRRSPVGRAWLAATGVELEYGLFPLLALLHDRVTTRRRDRYFALKAIACDVAEDEPELQPDYTSPTATVIARVGRFLWKKGYGADSLGRGGLVQHSAAHIPSWVLDFTEAASFIRVSTWLPGTNKAAGDTTFHATMTPGIDHLVTVRGMLVDRVDQEPHAELHVQVNRPLQQIQGKGVWGLLLEELALNMRAVFDDIAAVSPVPVGLSDGAVTSALIFGSELPGASCFRRGDEVWIIRGLQVPVLLRRSTDYPGCHQLVGSCYVHGVMNGEALEEGWEFEQVTLC
ncbi:d7eb814c-ccb0-4b83-9bcb-f4819d2c0ac6 [Thermothielavioides terrestris]|uniref:D7eb814c-ccb0-4b83-9bcb-f4819d2c0ac6 n=1 Tax=Thermothielavioides terrestris TaxID=2587410 RepID=A0A446BPI0_9PEZI|nr:d7eb814c-ccb0-4b83-9bcb-f4819d2c0ac6 [Thermothielavioides terrestris]